MSKKPLYYKIGDKLILAPDAPPVEQIISQPMPAAPTPSKLPPPPKCGDPLCRAPFTPNKGGASAKLCPKCYQHRRRANGKGIEDPGPAPSLIRPQQPAKPKPQSPPPDASSNRRIVIEKSRNIGKDLYQQAKPRAHRSAPTPQLHVEGEPLPCEACHRPTGFYRKKSPGSVTRCERCRKHFARHGVEWPNAAGQPLRKD